MQVTATTTGFRLIPDFRAATDRAGFPIGIAGAGIRFFLVPGFCLI